MSPTDNTASTTGNAMPNIAAPGAASYGGNSPNVATGQTPNFTSAAPPPVGTVFSFNQSAVKLTSTTASDASIGGGTLTLTLPTGTPGTVIVLNGELKIPGASLDVPLFSAGLNGATSGGAPNGGGIFNADFGALNYTILGRWDYQPSSGTAFFGYSLGGYQAPTTGVPSAGTATFSGTASSQLEPTTTSSGGAFAQIFTPNLSGGVVRTPVAGNASVSVNFSGGSVTGSLTNMVFNGGGIGALPWNDVTLTGTLSGATISGTTATSGPPANSGGIGFASNSTGKFNGALYGPNGQEVGAIWTLYDPSGKSAIGALAAKQ